MANNQNTFTFGFALMQLLITILGTNRTGKTGAEKKAQVVDAIEPILNLGAQVAENNTNNATTKAEIALGVQAVHDTLLTAGIIHDTAALEAGTADVVPQTPPTINIHVAPPAPAAAANPPAAEPSADGPKYRQWLRLATQGVMPSNQALAADRYVTGDQLFNDSDASNAAEFYFVVESTLQGFAPPHSPTNRIARLAGLVG